MEGVLNVWPLEEGNRFEEMVNVFSNMIGFAINITDDGTTGWYAKRDTP